MIAETVACPAPPEWWPIILVSIVLGVIIGYVIRCEIEYARRVQRSRDLHPSRSWSDEHKQREMWEK